MDGNGRYVLELREIDRTMTPLVGGKGANLGELARIDGIHVPDGFCVTTEAFEASGGQAIHPDVAAAIARALERSGADAAYAVRSSATAEDLPHASFAGQHDSFLGVVGTAAVLEHVRRCWASLFTDRAVAYRERNGIDHDTVRMAVVVQRMVAADAAGVLFTADPLNGNRRIACVEATVGLGEALVAGEVNADIARVRDGAVVERTMAAARPTLTDEQTVRLVASGRRIEAHFGAPQDIEWCRAGDGFQFVQSRPITTLFPIPARDDAEPHVYLSVGHQQMMTDAMPPLAISVRQLTAAGVFHEAGGRHFVDVTRILASPASRAGFLAMVNRSDPLFAGPIQTIVERGDFLPPPPDAPPAGPPPNAPPNAPSNAPPAPIPTDRAIVDALIARNEASIAALRRDVQGKSGSALLDFLRADFDELKRQLVEPPVHQAIMAGMEAAWWLNEKLEAWLGEKNAADALTLSVPDNVTSEMGLALLDVADAIRPHPEVVAFLERVERDDFLDELPNVPGGAAARDAIVRWLERYGVRCVGEIDLSRPRWSEHPIAIVHMILANVRNFEPGASARRFEQGRCEALRKKEEILERLRALPDGAEKADETERMIERVRTFAGYREYPKYGMICRYAVYRRALLAEAERLVAAGALRARDDVFYLTFPELQEAVRTMTVDDALIRERAATFRVHRTLTVPRVLTSDGEAVASAPRRDALPAGALVGLPVSAGIVEGRARVILDIADADLGPGDILVTPFTDPSWTPVFVAIAGLVTEVGGLMTHGAVIAREYGLPAVVGVEHATTLIADGQRIRVNAIDGYVEILR